MPSLSFAQCESSANKPKKKRKKKNEKHTHSHSVYTRQTTRACCTLAVRSPAIVVHRLSVCMGTFLFVIFVTLVVPRFLSYIAFCLAIRDCRVLSAPPIKRYFDRRKVTKTEQQQNNEKKKKKDTEEYQVKNEATIWCACIRCQITQ